MKEAKQTNSNRNIGSLKNIYQYYSRCWNCCFPDQMHLINPHPLEAIRFQQLSGKNSRVTNLSCRYTECTRSRGQQLQVVAVKLVWHFSETVSLHNKGYKWGFTVTNESDSHTVLYPMSLPNEQKAVIRNMTVTAHVNKICLECLHISLTI
jgi:hypothetical protein